MEIGDNEGTTKTITIQYYYKKVSLSTWTRVGNKPKTLKMRTAWNPV